MRRLTMAAAVVGSIVGTAAYGHDHNAGEIGWPNCSFYPFECLDLCYELTSCLFEGEEIDCISERSSLEQCAAFPPPIIIPPPPVIILPPPACPAGQQFQERECQAECGDDEVAGEDGSCTECGEGEVPNHDGTACFACAHGESVAGTCDPACWRKATDDAAVAALGEYPAKKPFERGVMIHCLNEKPERHIWATSTDNACQVKPRPRYSESCWEGGNKETGCNLALVHTHPWFTKADADAMCHGSPVGEDPDRIFRLNRENMKFSWKDESETRQLGVEAHLGVSNRTCVKAFRRSGRKETVSGTCVPVEPPNEETQ